MKSRMSKTLIGMAAAAAVVGTVPAIAQDANAHLSKHHHYKLVELDTFGGPTSSVCVEPTGNIANLAGDLSQE